MGENDKPTWMDHYNLNFWLWACLSDAEAYLAASEHLMASVRKLGQSGENFAAANAERLLAQQHDMLAKYHFVSTMGSLLRNLNRLQELFPSIQPAYDKAEHLRTEGKLLRDMIEHADEYLAGKGRKQDKFVRESPDLLTSIPGDKPGTADATATLIDEKGHWLGGRLNVERVISELRPLIEEAKKIPAPLPAGLS